MAKKKSVKISIDSLKHKDKRANIPTAELQNFVQEDEIKPKKIIYPRDPHLDPVRKQVAIFTPIRDKSQIRFMIGYKKYFWVGWQALSKLSNGVDPQLVWAGKAEHTSFEITTVSLHIHERIAPEAIIRSIKREEPQADLFRGVEGQ